MIPKSFGWTRPNQSYYSTMLITIISPIQQEPKNSQYSYNTISPGCSSHLLLQPSLTALKPKLKNQPFGEVATSESHKLPSFRQKKQESLLHSLNREHRRIGRMILMSCSEGLTKAIILFNHAHHRHHHVLKSNKNLRFLKLPATQSRREATHTHLCNQA